MDKKLALTWQLTEMHGWGLVGVHTALHLLDIGQPPLLLEKPLISSLRPQNRDRLQKLEDGYRQVMAVAAQNPGQTLLVKEFDVLHALGNGFVPGTPSARFRGRRNIGVVAFEDTLLTDEVIGRARSYDRMVVHSTYNHDLLAERGVSEIGVALQGVDPSEMGPRPPSGRFKDRFVIFSGGKLEFRKSQDIVLEAFRRFRQRHADAVLATAWHNPWAYLAAGIAESRLTPQAPEVDDKGRLKIVEWATAHGVPADSFVDLGFLGRDQIAPVLADCAVAVFPNRCEGATNLVAMEAMACGVPVILSANTGHRDIIRDDACFALTRQDPVPDPTGARIGWGESSVEELVEHLETLYTDRETARRRSCNAMRFILGERTWKNFAQAFVAVA
jgi:glycosyltransferase involved in cell wall biosynthesis